MDVLVTWRDGTKNVVSTNEIQTVRKGEKFKIGVKIKMLYKQKWYYGTISDMENVEMEDSSSDDEPLSKYATMNKTKSNNSCEYNNCHNSILTTCFRCGCFLCAEHFDTTEACDKNHFANITLNQKITSNQANHDNVEDILGFCEIDFFDSQENVPEINLDNEHIKYCEFSACTEEIFSACHRCSCLLCWDHFYNCGSTCENHFSSASLNVYIHLPVLKTNKQRCEFISCTNPVLATCFVCNCFLCDVHFEGTAEQSCFNYKQLDHGEPQKTLQQNLIEEPLTDCEDNMEVDILNASNETAVLLDVLDESPSILRQGDSETAQSLFCEYPACVNVTTSNCSGCTLPLCSEHLSVHIALCANIIHAQTEILLPENFVIDGAPRENVQVKSKRVNKFMQAKSLRQHGKEYISPYTKKVVPEKKIGTMCNLENCARYGNYCYLFTEDDRENILLDYYSTGNISLQREYIARFTDKKPVARRTNATESRRQFTLNFYLPQKDKKHKVCKKMFLNTLQISEKSVCTSLEKIKDTGILENDRRGGRQRMYVAEDAKKRANIQAHLNRFPRVESHYCRKDSCKEYLHPDLTLRKMYSMFLDEYETKVSFTLYRSVFKEMNLSIHRPKKDQCGLCVTYREGSTEVKEKLQDKYMQHISEKDEVRKIKTDCKNETSDTIRCTSFDLQQVIYLPKSNESAIFYKRRLANFNFTIYDLSSKECTCNLWHEAVSNRGASEISKAVFNFLAHYDTQGVEKVYLFCDGCQGQNKNSVMASMLMYFLMHSKTVEEISLRFFCPSHGQSEGDSVHSAVSYAMSKALNIYVPSQLVPIIRLARKNPYNVKEYNYNDFMDFKDFSQKIKILQLRKDDQTGAPVKWTDMMEFRVTKNKPSTLFFKTSHLENEYRSVSVKRQHFNHFRNEINPVHKSDEKKNK